jgi:uncharacterized protein YqgC (DUF456 family)
MAYVLLLAAELLGVALVPFGLPGLWLQVAALAGYAWWSGFQAVGWIPVLVVTALALVAETAEFLLGGRYARRYGGSRRAAWGATLGGLVGALVGFPLPLLGSIFGAMAGCFVGAFALELTTGRGAAPAARAGWGALLGHTLAIAMKVSVGMVILVLTAVSAAA